ncbi:MAG: Phosphoglycerate dehydrogenase [Erysipelotrichaceae bacterium]|nr:MAG: Phosphoglycerate [Erysipelotrichaceae bacterium]TXT18875.1 MAG: Phosphoglycerate dehydrogenase [Erysipelotrichaceae bacterium]
MKILISELSPLPLDVKERFSNAGIEVDYLDDMESFDPSLYDVIYGRIPIALHPYNAFTNLKFIQLSLAGYDSMPIQKWLSDGKLISNAKGVFSAPIAEMTVMHILMAIKLQPEFAAQQKAHVWKRHEVREMGFLKILFLGTGSIAAETALRLKPFGLLLIGLNTNGREVEPFNVTGKMSEVHEYLRSADIVINTLPYSPETHHLMNEAFFETLKSGAIIANVGRGKTVDEVALLKALRSDQISFAYLDVFESEPLDANSPLWDHPKVMITPHNSNSGQLTKERNYTNFINNIQHYLAGEPLENQL